MTDHIVGMDRAESDALLEDLFQVLEDPAHCYEHVWTPGDLVMWDNGYAFTRDLVRPVNGPAPPSDNGGWRNAASGVRGRGLNSQAVAGAPGEGTHDDPHYHRQKRNADCVDISSTLQMFQNIAR